MSDFIVSQHSDNVLVVDSRLIAQELGIEHENFIETVKKYQKQAEQAFGVLRFETGKPTGGSLGGRPEKYCLLTEEQATFYMTLSRNTPEVVELKIKLVKAFSEAKRLLLGLGVVQPPTTTIYIQRLQNMADHTVAYDVWTTFREGAEILLMVEKEYKVPVSQMDLCDGSIGSHWVQYREEIDIKNPIKKYIHRFRDHRPDVTPNAFEYSELPVFRKWLEEIYTLNHLPKYLVDKYGKRAARQIYEEQGKLTDYIVEITEEKRITPKQEELYQVFLAARDAISYRELLN
jgi:Phage regulatory protein Rha (Phage_pRha)